MTTVLITGANGFLGTALTKRALDRGYRVRALCLSGTPADGVAGLGAEAVFGDILRPETLVDAMDGVDVVFHVAGSTLEWHAEPEAVYRINAIGTRNVCAAALAGGVRRLVHTSTMSAVGSADARAGTHDEDRLFDLFDTGLYARSKLLGEMEALRAGARGLDVVVCCPHQILGAGDVGPSTPGRIVILFAQGRIPFYVNVRSQFLGVEDCAEGHLLAAEKGTRAERYILAGPEAVDMRTFFAACAELTGRRAPRLAVPRWLVALVAAPMEWMADHVTRRPPLLTAGNAVVLYKDMTCSIRKAAEHLGFAPGPWRAALTQAVAWFRENGYFERALN